MDKVKFSFVVSDVLAPLKNVVSIIPSNAMFPILSSMKIKLNKRHWEIFATDIDNSIIYKSDKIQIEESGEILVSGKMFYDVLKNIKGEVIFEGDDKKLKGTYPQGEFTLPLLILDDFPVKPQVKEKTCKIVSEELKELIEDLLFIVPTSGNVRRGFSGMCWEYKKGELTLVTTDSFRLGFSTIKLNLGENPFQIIVHPNILKQFIDNESKEIDLFISEREIMFADAQYNLTSQLIKADFVEWRNIQSKDKSNKLVLSRSLLEETLKRVSTFCVSDSRGVNFTLYKDGNAITLASDATVLGQGVENIPIIEYKGEDMKIVLSSTYLQDILKHIKTDEVYLEIYGPHTPIKIYEKGKRIEYFLMPMEI